MACLTSSIAICDDRRPYRCLRYDRWDNFDEKAMKSTRSKCQRRKRRRSLVLGSASSASASASASPRAQTYQQVLKDARQKFTQEISFQSKDKDVSLARALLYIAAEDEAFMAFNREMDALSISSERKGVSGLSRAQDLEWSTVEGMPLAGRNMHDWQAELDAIAKEVEVELISKDIGCHLAQVLEAVNVVLFESRGFRRSSVLGDANNSYLHLVLSSGSGIGEV